MKTLSCASCRAALTQLLDAGADLPSTGGAPAPDDASRDGMSAAMARHLATCPDCARELALLRAVRDSSRALGEATAPAALRGNVRTALQAEATGRRPQAENAWTRRPGARRSWQPAFAWSGGVALAAFALFATMRSPQPSLTIPATAPDAARHETPAATEKAAGNAPDQSGPGKKSAGPVHGAGQARAAGGAIPAAKAPGHTAPAGAGSPTPDGGSALGGSPPAATIAPPHEPSAARPLHNPFEQGEKEDSAPTARPKKAPERSATQAKNEATAPLQSAPVQPGAARAPKQTGTNAAVPATPAAREMQRAARAARPVTADVPVAAAGAPAAALAVPATPVLRAASGAPMANAVASPPAVVGAAASPAAPSPSGGAAFVRLALLPRTADATLDNGPGKAAELPSGAPGKTATRDMDENATIPKFGALATTARTALKPADETASGGPRAAAGPQGPAGPQGVNNAPEAVMEPRFAARTEVAGRSNASSDNATSESASGGGIRPPAGNFGFGDSGAQSDAGRRGTGGWNGAAPEGGRPDSGSKRARHKTARNNDTTVKNRDGDAGAESPDIRVAKPARAALGPALPQGKTAFDGLFAARTPKRATFYGSLPRAGTGGAFTNTSIIAPLLTSETRRALLVVTPPRAAQNVRVCVTVDGLAFPGVHDGVVWRGDVAKDTDLVLPLEVRALRAGPVRARVTLETAEGTILSEGTVELFAAP